MCADQNFWMLFVGCMAGMLFGAAIVYTWTGPSTGRISQPPVGPPAPPIPPQEQMFPLHCIQQQGHTLSTGSYDEAVKICRCRVQRHCCRGDNGQ